MPHCKKNCISFLLTSKCNLNCLYCYSKESHARQKSLDINFAKKAIDDFYNQFGHVYLRFFGEGEPTLEMGKIKEIIKYCKKFTNVESELQTNGFFNEDTCKWIGKNIDIVWISCDGPEEIQNYYRPAINNTKSSNIVERNIKYLAKKVKLGIRTSIGRKNINKQKQIIDYFCVLGVKYIYTDILFKPIGSKLKEESIFPLEYAKKFIIAKRYAAHKNIFYGSFFEINFDGKTKYFCRFCNPSPHLTTDNYITCCDMAYNGEIFPEMAYGKYNPKTDIITYDKKKIKHILERNVDNMKECENCEVKYFCGGGCIGECANEKGDMFKIKKENCEAIRFLAKKIGCDNGKYPIYHP